MNIDIYHIDQPEDEVIDRQDLELPFPEDITDRVNQVACRTIKTHGSS